MRVPISGGCGLIRRALVHDLASAGNEVIILSRQPEEASGLPHGVIVERWDGLSRDGWATRAGGSDGIVNLAGENMTESTGILASCKRKSRQTHTKQFRCHLKNNGNLKNRLIAQAYGFLIAAEPA